MSYQDLHPNRRVMGTGKVCSSCGANYNYIFNYCPDCGKCHVPEGKEGYPLGKPWENEDSREEDAKWKRIHIDFLNFAVIPRGVIDNVVGNISTALLIAGDFTEHISEVVQKGPNLLWVHTRTWRKNEMVEMDGRSLNYLGRDSDD